MGLLALLAVLTAIGLAGLFAITMLVKAVLWAVFLPLRLVGWLFLPLLLVFKLLVGIVLLVVAGPIVLVAILVAILAAIAALAVPLLPLFFIGFVAWLLMRSSRTATA